VEHGDRGGRGEHPGRPWAIVVLQLLRAELVTAHLGMAMVIVACLGIPSWSTRHRHEPLPSRSSGTSPTPASCAVIAGLCFIQILIGGHVTGHQRRSRLHRLPADGRGAVPPDHHEREAFHVAHRLVAYVLAGGIVYLCIRAVRYKRALVEDGRVG
jgi:heme a synthase